MKIQNDIDIDKLERSFFIRNYSTLYTDFSFLKKNVSVKNSYLRKIQEIFLSDTYNLYNGKRIAELLSSKFNIEIQGKYNYLVREFENKNPIWKYIDKPNLKNTNDVQEFLNIVEPQLKE